MKNIKQSIKDKYNQLVHSKKTGQRLTPITDAIDSLTKINTERKLSAKELTKLRALTVGSTALKVGSGVTAGVVLGKTAFTGGLIAIGGYVVSDILVYAPMQTITEKVLTIKTK